MHVNEMREWLIENRAELRDFVEALSDGDVEGAEFVSDADAVHAQLAGALRRFDSAVLALGRRRSAEAAEVNFDEDVAEVLS